MYHLIKQMFTIICSSIFSDSFAAFLGLCELLYSIQKSWESCFIHH